MAWRLPGLFLHIVNAALLFRIAMRIGGRPTAFVSAALFVAHGSRPEAVAWMGATRFDVLGCFFVLLCAGFMFEWADRGRPAFLCLAGIAEAAALATKESTYVAPALIAILLLCGGRLSRATLRGVCLLAVIAVLVFVCRWQLLGGVGGYMDAQTGQAAFYLMPVLSSLKAVAWRLWAILLFPLNWSVEFNIALRTALALFPIALFLMPGTLASRKRIVLLALAVMLSSLPALPVLSIGADLTGSRVLYLPTVSFALLVGLIIGQMRGWRQLCAGSLLLALNLAALRNNLDQWDRVAHIAEATCQTIVRETESKAVVVRGMPSTLDGVMFLGNGLAGCLSYYGLPTGVQLHTEGDPPSGAAVFTWDPVARRVTQP